MPPETTGRKKILYLITKGNFGGAQRYVFDLATNLDKNIYNAIVAFGEGGVLEKKLNERGIPTIRIEALHHRITFFSDIIAFFSLLRLLSREKPDIVHLNSSKAGLLGSLAARTANGLNFLTGKRSTRIIFTGHGWAFNEKRSLVQKSLFLFLHYITIALSHGTIAVSERTMDQVKHLPFIKKKIRRIYNGIEPFPLASQSEARHILAPEAHERIWIGTISELHDNKGIDLLLESFALLAPRYANIVLVIVGTGKELDSLKKRAADLAISDRVHFAGFVENAQTYLRAFDIFTLTSRTEAFPYALLEAGMAELPVVASWAGGIPELIGNGRDGVLVDPVKGEELASALESYIVDQEQRNQMARSLHARVSDAFPFSKMLEATAELYGR